MNIDILSNPPGVYIFLGLLGLFIGSFLNVCIHRMPRDLSIVSPGSACPGCSAPIRWYDNIPVVSWILLRGRCRSCRASISWRYPMVEILTALLLVGIWCWYLGVETPSGRGMRPDRGLFYMHAILAVLMLAITFIDFEFRIIPDELTLPGIVFAPLIAFLYPGLHGGFGLLSVPGIGPEPGRWAALGASLLGILVGGGMLLALAWIGEKIFKKEAMGGGDVKLMAMLGGFLGWQPVFFAFWLGAVLGAIYGVAAWFVTRDRYMPYGPFLALATLLVMLFHPQIADWMRSYLIL